MNELAHIYELVNHGPSGILDGWVAMRVPEVVVGDVMKIGVSTVQVCNIYKSVIKNSTCKL